MKKENKGITLIALVITIIVLLILAGVTIVTLTGDNGLLWKTSESKFITEIQQYNEELKLAITEDYASSMGNRQNKFNVRRNSYNDDNSFTDAMKEKIPNFDKKYANKLEIKEDVLTYIGEDEKERGWLAQTISVAGMLKISYKYENGTEAAPTYQKVITDGSYEVESPKIEGYEPDYYIVEGAADKDTDVTVTYYGESQGLDYELLEDGTYTVSGIGTFTGENLVIPQKYEEKDITEIKRAVFYKNSTIKKLIIGDNIKKINSDAFKECRKLEYLNLDAKVIDSYAAFCGCGLKKIDIGTNVSSIGAWTFWNNTNLTDVKSYSENWGPSADIFSGCINLKEIKINEENNKYKSINGVIYSKDGKTLCCYPTAKEEEVIISDNVETIRQAAFAYNNTITKIVIPSTVNVVDSDAFIGCKNLEYLELNAKTVNSYAAFGNCGKLKEILIGKNIISMGGQIFTGCKNVNKVNYLGSVLEWNSISGTSNINNNSNITQVICTDGTIDL